MGITLLKPNQTWPQIRILHAKTFGATSAAPATSGTAWTVLPMQGEGQKRHGFEFLDCDRACLPFVGRARFKLEFGLFTDGIYSADPASVASLQTGEPWNPDDDQLFLNDLRGHEIRIQESEDGTTWRTIWWGQCEYQEDIGSPGATIPRGTRIYHCVDGLQRANRWMMSVHGYHDGTFTIPATAANSLARGAAGYNVPNQQDAIYAKNRSNTTLLAESGYNTFCHTAPGRGDGYWTAQSAVQHALVVSRPAGEPRFAFPTNPEPLLESVHAWAVRESDTAMDVLVNICRRERGRGTVYVDWSEAAAEGPLTVFLKVKPQLILDVTYTDPTTLDVITIAGAETAGTVYQDVDLIGDHRAVESGFKLGDPYQYRYDYLETLGEQIEVAVTLAYIDGQTGSTGEWVGEAIAPGWTNDEATAFKALIDADEPQRNVFRFRTVFQLHTLRQDWSGQAGDGNGGATVALQRVDYSCDADGNIVTPSGDPDTSPMKIELMSDLPMFERYDYTNTVPTLYDTTDTLAPNNRRRMIPLVRIDDDRYLTHDQTGAHTTLAADKSHVWVIHSDDEEHPSRFFSDTSDDTLGATYDYNQIVLSVGMRLPHRVRFASGDSTGRKRAQIIHDNFHLWLAAPGTIWELDPTIGDESEGYGVKRNAGNGSFIGGPGILRDDRAGLAALHALSFAWYGPGTDRRSSAWALRCCGFAPSFQAVPEITDNPTADNVTTINYPTLGQLVNLLSANGESHIINTPITRIAYDHKSGITSWSTEWSELETER